MGPTCQICLALVLLKDDKYKDNGVTLMHDEMQPLDTNLPPSTPGPENVDHEGAMAKADLFKLANYSVKLFKKIDDNDQLESWVQAKITKAADYVASVYHYLEYEMKFSEFGSKLENSEMYTESEKKELKNKLMEAKEKVKELKKLQADKMSGKKTVKVKESWDDDDEDPDVAKADKELKKKGVKLPKVKVDPDKDISKLAKKSKKEDDLDESWDDEDDDVKKADSELKKMGKKPIKAHSKADPDKDMSKLAKKSKKDDDDLDESWDDQLDELSSKTLKGYVDKRQWDTGTDPKMQKKRDTGLERAEKKIKDKDESKNTVKEAVKKAKKDYDGDGKIESDKDEVWGSRMKAAAKKSKKVDESWDDEDDDVKKADSELKKMGKKPIKAHAKADPDKDISKLAKKSKKEDDLDETSDEENDIISAPQPQPEPNPEENDVISAPMNESRELDRIRMLSGL